MKTPNPIRSRKPRIGNRAILGMIRENVKAATDLTGERAWTSR
jgi:hypothetical protein